MSFNTGTYVTNYEDSKVCGSDSEWEERNYPIGCIGHNSWNLGCNGCRENYDAVGQKPPCQPYFDEIEERTKQVLLDEYRTDMWCSNGDKRMILVNAVPYNAIELKIKFIIEHTIRLEHELELTQKQRDIYRAKALKYECGLHKYGKGCHFENCNYRNCEYCEPVLKAIEEEETDE